jgi:cbb3-type cytochrome oxidase subunit 1
MFFAGMLIMAYNVWMTVRRERPAPVPVLAADAVVASGGS